MHRWGSAGRPPGTRARTRFRKTQARFSLDPGCITRAKAERTTNESAAAAKGFEDGEVGFEVLGLGPRSLIRWRLRIAPARSNSMEAHMSKGEEIGITLCLGQRAGMAVRLTFHGILVGPRRAAFEFPRAELLRNIRI